MGEILHPMSFDYQDNRTVGPNRGKSKPDAVNFSSTGGGRGHNESELRSGHLLSTAEEMAVYAKSIQVDDSSQRAYMRYCDDAIEPEVYIEEKTSNSVYDFEKSLHALSVGYEDVRGMEELAASSHISDIVATGQYQGMQQGESAILATALASSTLVFVEPQLQVEESDRLSMSSHGMLSSSVNLNHLSKSANFKHASLPLPSSSSASRSSSFSEYNSLLVSPNKADLLMAPDERVPAMQKEQSLINKRASPKYSVELTERARSKVEDIWNANTHFSQVGLEETIHSDLNKYLYSQHIYGQEVDPERLAKR